MRTLSLYHHHFFTIVTTKQKQISKTFFSFSCHNTCFFFLLFTSKSLLKGDLLLQIHTAVLVSFLLFLHFISFLERKKETNVVCSTFLKISSLKFGATWLFSFLLFRFWIFLLFKLLLDHQLFFIGPFAPISNFKFIFLLLFFFLPKAFFHFYF